MSQETPIRAGALFVDFENVYYAMLNGPFQLHREDALAVSLEAIQGVRKHLRDDGYALVVERSYADWDQIPENAQRQLQISGVLPRYADSRVDKNTADIELSLDLLQHILTQPESQHVVLIGGDRDYLPILRRVKERQRHISVVSLRRCLSGDVREFVSNYTLARIVELDEFVRRTDTGRRQRSNVPPPQWGAGPIDPSSAAAQGILVDAPAPKQKTRERSVESDEASSTSASVDPTANVPSSAVPGNRRLGSDDWDEADDEEDWQGVYVKTMLRFMSERRYSEIHLAPFFRWLNAEGVFERISASEQRKIFNQLQEIGVVCVEERDGVPHPYSVAIMNWDHPVVQRLSSNTNQW